MSTAYHAEGCGGKHPRRAAGGAGRERRAGAGGPTRLARPTAVALLMVLGIAGCAPAVVVGPPLPDPAAPAVEVAPPVAREMRGVWVATVSNIDWPSSPGLPAEQQRAELLAILDRAVELRLNVIVLQVRPAADALYASDLEPWSEYLTGSAGEAPEPAYDPLEFAVTEAHRRGLELHAWFNPYRARHPSAVSSIPESHISRTRPDLVWVYGRHLWMDPGEPEVQDRTVEVVLDVVRRYDVDGVHMDDYFYPYRETDLRGNRLPFPDSASYARYREAGGTLDRHDWRRHNVDTLIERLYREVRAEKPWVKFGISPFGVWRPGHPRGIGGFDAYSELYADARKWLANGWVDYFTPQLYWPIARPDVSYPLLLRWWVEQNVAGRHVWPGNFTNRVGDGSATEWAAEEVIGQVFVTRGQAGATGNVHFSARSLMQRPDSLGERLVGAVYGEPALVPASPWMGGSAPAVPDARVGGAGASRAVELEPGAEGGVWLWTVRTRGADRWTTEVLPGATRRHPLDPSVSEVVVTAVGRTGLESPPVRLITTPAGAPAAGPTRSDP